MYTIILACFGGSLFSEYIGDSANGLNIGLHLLCSYATLLLFSSLFEVCNRVCQEKQEMFPVRE